MKIDVYCLVKPDEIQLLLKLVHLKQKSDMEMEDKVNECFNIINSVIYITTKGRHDNKFALC